MSLLCTFDMLLLTLSRSQTPLLQPKPLHHLSHNVHPLDHGSGAQISTREPLLNGTPHLVANEVLDDVEVARCERVRIHEGVHRWVEDGGRAGGEGAQEGRLTGRNSVEKQTE